MMIYIVWRNPRPWEDAHKHLDSVHTSLIAASDRALKYQGVCPAWIEPIHEGQPYDKSVLGES